MDAKTAAGIHRDILALDTLNSIDGVMAPLRNVQQPAAE
jgi:hypothetical protein